MIDPIEVEVYRAKQTNYIIAGIVLLALLVFVAVILTNVLNFMMIYAGI